MKAKILRRLCTAFKNVNLIWDVPKHVKSLNNLNEQEFILKNWQRFKECFNVIKKLKIGKKHFKNMISTNKIFK